MNTPSHSLMTPLARLAALAGILLLIPSVPAQTNGPVVAWGREDVVAFAPPPGLGDVVAVAASADRSFALLRDGSLIQWGGAAGAPPQDDPWGLGVLTNLSAIAPGEGFLAAITRDSRLVVRGSGPATTNPPALSRVAAVAAGAAHGLALTPDGLVTAWGENSYGQTSVPPSLSNVVAVAAGIYRSAALRRDGSVVCWGLGLAPEGLTTPNTTVPAVGVWFFSTESLALAADGALRGTAEANSGQSHLPEGLDSVVWASPGGRKDYAVRADGSVFTWVWYPDPGSFAPPEDLGGVTQTAAGDFHGLALVAEGAPFLLQQPLSQSTYTGQRVVLRAPATGRWPLSCQWQFQGAAIPGATNHWLVLNAPQTSDSGAYCLVVTNSEGSLTSAVAQLSFVPSAPVVLAEPSSFSGPFYGMAHFETRLEGSFPLSYQWHHDGQALPGATNSTLDFLYDAAYEGGGYWCAVSNSLGASTTAVAQLSTVPPGSLDSWTWQNPAPQGNDLLSLAASPSLRVAVGEQGTLVLSTNGADWTCVYHPFNTRFEAAAWGNDRFVAIGRLNNTALNVAAVSTNGLDWRMHPIGPASDTHALLFSQGRFIANGYAPDTGLPCFMISTNGASWTLASAPVNAGPLSAIAAGPAGLAAVGHRLVWSADGLAWNDALDADERDDFDTVVCGNTKFIAYNEPIFTNRWAWVSTNLVYWEHIQVQGIPNNYPILSAAFAHGRFVAVTYSPSQDDHQVWTSTDGLTYAPASVPRPQGFLTVIPAPEGFTLAGKYGALATLPADGGPVLSHAGGTTANLRDIVRGDSLYMAVGNEGLVLTSPDGLSWTRQPAPTPNNLRGAAFGQGLFVAVGDNGVICVSPNAIDWRLVPGLRPSLYRVRYAAGRFVAGGDRGALAVSTNGAGWISLTAPTSSRLHGITYGKGLFVATGRDGAIHTSPDAINWTFRASGTTAYLQSIAFGNGLFVAAGDAAVVVSSDAVNWQPFSRQDLWTSFEAVGFGDGRFLLVGDKQTVFSSTDGLDWRTHETRCASTFRAVCHTGDRFLLAGNNQAILQSGLTRASLEGRMNLGAFELLLRGQLNQPYTLQSSTNLKSWISLLTLTNIAPVTPFRVAGGASAPFRFYRLLREP